MSYDDKVDRACQLLSAHHIAIGESDDGVAEKFRKNLISIGGTTEQSLKHCSWEDLEAFVPRLLAREICNIFRGGSSSPVKSAKKVSNLPPQDLVDLYDQDNPLNAVGKRLNELSNGKPFIVYDDNKTISKDVTKQLLLELIKGYPPRSDYTLNGTIVGTYKVGKKPADYADENPLYHGQPLRPDGTCFQTGRSWMGVDKSIRQLIYIARQTKEISISSIDDANDIIDRVFDDNAMDKLCSRYRNAARKFAELSKEDDLPKMKVQIEESSRVSTRQNNPFGKEVIYG